MPVTSIKNRFPRTFMDVLHDTLSMAHLCRRERVHGVLQIRNRSPAHFMLMRDGRNHELPWLLLDNRERRRLDLLHRGSRVYAVSDKPTVSLVDD